MNLSTDEKTTIQSMIDGLGRNHELEVSFSNSERGVPYPTFSRLVKWASKNLKMSKSIELDILYQPLRSEHTIKTYRFTVKGLATINKVLKVNMTRASHLIVRYILSEFLDGKLDMNTIIKTKENKHDFRDYGCRMRLAEEKPISKDLIKDLHKNIRKDDCGQILFRFKHRMSAVLKKNYQLDCTAVVQTTSLEQVRSGHKTYEVELEILSKKEKVKAIEESIMTVSKVLGSSDEIVSKTVANKVLQNFYSLTSTYNKSMPMMKTKSLTLKEATQDITDGYCPTAKLDGERRFIFVTDGSTYLLDTNMQVYGGPPLAKGVDVSKYDGTIIDTEYAYIRNDKCHLISAFDLLYYKGVDRRERFLQERRQYLHEALGEMFGYKHSFGNPSPKESKTVAGMVAFYGKQLSKNWEYTSKMLEKSRYFVDNKYFLSPIGISPTEVYAYMRVIWEKQDCFPLPLDGIILSSISQVYTSQTRKVRFSDLKWKPENMNSIDFWVTAVTNPKTKKPEVVYNNIDEEENGGTAPYQVFHLHVGRKTSRGEEPVFFCSEKDLHVAHIPLQPDNTVRDIEGNIIQGNTVVEFVYDQRDKNTPQSKRWIPLRTRHDKTEAVRHFKRKYGNFENIASSVFDTIQNPFTFEHIKLMSDSDTFERTKVKLIGMENGQVDDEQDKQAYYQKISAEAQEMRSFTSWVKSMLIATAKGRLLDWGVGQGGDVIKYMHSDAITEVVGIDPNPSGLYSTNGAISRYNNMKRQFKDAKQMHFIQYNPSIPLAKQKTVGNKENRQMIQKYLGDQNKYDTVCSFFSFHYNFESNETLEAAMNLLSSLVKKGGNVIIITFDGELVYEALKKADGVLKLEYPTQNKSSTLFEIRRKYPKQSFSKITTGAAIDLYNAIFMNAGQFRTEYLVPPKVLEAKMKKHKFALAETKLIEDFYNLEFFEQKFNRETKPSLKSRLENIINYGKLKNPVIDACHTYNSMFRYYRFTKK
jgi:hypothetical protein